MDKRIFRYYYCGPPSFPPSLAFLSIAIMYTFLGHKLASSPDKAKAMSYFYEAYSLIKSEIKDLVKKAANMYPETDILFTGHSLGGYV